MSSASLPLIPEILRLICEQIHDKPTLACLARTCAAFENPALDILWFDIRGLYPLAKCLPSQLWMEVQRKVDNTQATYIVLRNALVREDCARLIKNAKRVNRYAFQTYYNAKYVDITVYETLQAAMYGRTLLPNIRSLDWSFSEREPFSFSFIYLFLGPHLTSVGIAATLKNFTPQLSFLLTLSSVYPSLKHVRFSPPFLPDAPTYEQAVKHISGFVFQWQNLETLHVHSLTCAALEKVSLLPNLKILELDFWTPDSTQPHVQKGGFAALNNLTIHPGSLGNFQVFLQYMDSSPVESLEFTLDYKESPESWRDALNALREHCSPDKLKDISTSGHYDDEETVDIGDMLTTAIIIPLFAFQNLKFIDFEVPQGIYLSEPTDTEMMARSWPNIINLQILPPYYLETPQPSKITMVDLIPFAKYCPNLCYLAFRLDANSPPAVNKLKSGDKVSQTSLLTLDIDNSPAKYPSRIASFLARVFPSLRNIKTLESKMEDLNGYPDSSEDEDEEVNTDESMLSRKATWSHVQELLRKFSTTREHVGPNFEA